MNPDDLSICEECGDFITVDHPGTVLLVWGTKYPPGTSVALHDEDCRLAYFTDNPPQRWVKDHEVRHNP